MKPVGKPDAGNPHVRFDERGRETGRCRMAQATAPFLDSTNAAAAWRNAFLPGRLALDQTAGPSLPVFVIVVYNERGLDRTPAVRHRPGTRDNHRGYPRV
jgi:hypothetical protein